MLECVSEGTNIALYADDTKIWREIIDSNDHFALQKDIDSLYNLYVQNKMIFHPSKYIAVSTFNHKAM